MFRGFHIRGMLQQQAVLYSNPSVEQYLPQIIREKERQVVSGWIRQAEL